VTEAGYAADDLVAGATSADVEAPVGVVLEGGFYALGALARSTAATMEAMTTGGGAAGVGGLLTGGGASPVVAGAGAQFAPWWPELA